MPCPPALEKQHRPRTGGYHVRTGCITCKIRHVKCDEEKPACRKCRSTGRVCDGYLTTKKVRTSSATPHQEKQISSSEMVLIPPNPGGGFIWTDQERRGFDYFRWETDRDIGGVLNLDLVHRVMLQLGHTNAAVRSAVIALGSIAERLQVNNLLTSEKEQTHINHDFAQVQYSQAITELQGQIAKDPQRSEMVAIVSCLLFTLYDCLQGNNTASMVHLRSGLNILRQQGGPSDLLMHQLLRIFTALDLQATLWMSLQAFQTPILNPLKPDDLKIEVESFNHIEDAAFTLNLVISRVYHFRRLVTDEAGQRDSPIIIARKRDLGMQLEMWRSALERLLVDFGATLSVEMLHRTLVMTMNHTITQIAFGACLHEDEERVFRAHLADFRSIVSLAKTVLRPVDSLVLARVQRIVAANNASINPVAVFSFYAGVIQPLYMTATQCTDVKVRQEAIDLLSTPSWQEGAWDSATMARMAELCGRQREKRCFMAMALV